MPDSKSGPTTLPGAVAATGAASIAPAGVGGLLALFAVLAHAVVKVRLFEESDRDRTPWFETDLPAAGDLRPLADWLLTSPASVGEQAVLVASNSGAVPDRENRQDVFKALLDLLRPADSDALPITAPDAMAFLRTSPSVPPSNPRAAWGAIASLCEKTTPANDTVLDVFFHRPRRTFRIELSPAAGLRGESLDELRLKAPPLPASNEPPRHDLPRDAYFTAPAAARHLGVDRSTVTRRIGRNELVGFTMFKRALRIPREQFLDADVIPGVPEVLALFPLPGTGSSSMIDHKSAWAFLSGDLYHGDPEPRPIDRLRTAAARGTTPQVLAELVRTRESIDRGDHL